MNNNNIIVRKAVAADVPQIHQLLEPYADAGIVLRRSQEDILSYIENFRVAFYDDTRLCGCVAVRSFGNNLLEVRSLVVAPEFHGKGVGRALVQFVTEQLRKDFPDDNWSLFTLTGEPEFFKKQGFQVVSKEMFPEKIWSDCSKCSKKNCCDETALLFDHNFNRS